MRLLFCIQMEELHGYNNGYHEIDAEISRSIYETLYKIVLIDIAITTIAAY